MLASSQIRFSLPSDLETEIHYDRPQVFDPHMPFGVINIGDKEASFEAMDFIKHDDVLR